MRFRISPATIALFIAATLVLPTRADAQILKKLKKAAKNAVESETQAQVERLLRNAIRCVVDDPVCIEQAEAEGKDVVFVDDKGEVIMDEKGAPITDQAAAAKAAPPAPAPGEGAWANYDFVPGDRILFYDDYEKDRVGDFPRRLEFVKGNWEIVEWEGRRLLRNTGPRHSAFKVMLPEKLPDRFTIEVEAHLPHGNQQFVITTASPAGGQTWKSVGGNAFQVGVAHGTGVVHAASGTESKNRTDEVSQRIVPIRIMVDETYAKVYVNERRVANIPNAELQRGNALFFENTYFADEKQPMLLGPIRIAAGGADLYSRLEAEGRVATQGILFAINSDRIRPESTPTLDEIGSMLKEHGDLRLMIEGHTDSEGEEAYNRELSERRAAAVKSFLVERYGINAARLETAGFGESKPAADNTTAEGKQQNRRVELVRLGA